VSAASIDPRSPSVVLAIRSVQLAANPAMHARPSLQRAKRTRWSVLFIVALFAKTHQALGSIHKTAMIHIV
jgi:hypothetical protein